MLSRASRRSLRSSYLGIHEYFSRNKSSSFRNSNGSLTQAEAKLNDYQYEWLVEQEKQAYVDSGTSKPDRYDWRERASSRRIVRDTDRIVRKQIRRVAPPAASLTRYDPHYDAVTQYTERFMPLINAEEEEEESVLAKRLAEWPQSRLEKEGYCLTGMTSFWLEHSSFGRPVAAFWLGPGMNLPEDHRFLNGTQILVSRIDPLKEEPFKGNIISKTDSQLRVAFEERHELQSSVWRLDLGRSNIVYRRMREAVLALHHDPADFDSSEVHDRYTIPSSESSSGKRETVERETQHILQGTYLRDVLLRTFQPESQHLHASLQESDDVEYASRSTLEHGQRDVVSGEPLQKEETPLVRQPSGAFAQNCLIRSWARRYSVPGDPVVVEGDPDLSSLNSTQRRAVAMMLGDPISLVQGPPGTGKTKTIIETVKLLKVHFQVPQPILVCTYTNVAVDNLVEGLASANLRPLRLGSAGHVRESLIPHTLDARLEKHPEKSVYDRLTKEEERVTDELNALKASMKTTMERLLQGKESLRSRVENMGKAIDKMENQKARIKAKMYAVHQRMVRDILEECDVICTTCITSACADLRMIDFPVVFLDEASMSTEPASLIPLMKGSQHVALIGDHKQLPPVITSAEAQSNGLGISLFERLTEEGVVPSIMLDIQYRMHPTISKFPSSEFYNHALLDGTVSSSGIVSPHLLPPESMHLQRDEAGNRPSVVFLDHAGAESMKDRSRVNRSEANIIASVVEDLLIHNPKLKGSDIGIIAPYVAQINLLKRLFRTDKKQRARFAAVLGDARAMQTDHIEIQTVDGFEGREKEIIIFSTVRNNKGGYIGFLADRRRLNVGLTRAKRGLFVVGSISTLQSGKMAVVGEGRQQIVRVGKGAESWRRYAEYLTANAMVVSLASQGMEVALTARMKATRRVDVLRG